MSYRVRFGPEAAAEIEDAVRWYEQRHAGLRLAFLAAVDGAIETIVRWPESGAPIPEAAADLLVRRARIHRFPYHLAYLVIEDEIRVLAVAHDRRRPGYWKARAQDR